MIVAIHQPQYLPWIGYFDRMSRVDQFVFLDNVQYVRDYFQQRTKIRTSQGWTWLTVPVHYKSSEKTPIKDVEIGNSLNWRRKHWESLRVNYGRAPFFGEYGERLRDLYEKEWESLGDLNIATIEVLAEAFGVTTPCVRASELAGVGGAKTELLVSICREVGARTYFSGPTGRTYLVPDRFADEGIEIVYHDFEHPVYGQVYGEPFEPFMSAADMLFCCGPSSTGILGTTGVLKKDRA